MNFVGVFFDTKLSENKSEDRGFNIEQPVFAQRLKQL